MWFLNLSAFATRYINNIYTIFIFFLFAIAFSLIEYGFISVTNCIKYTCRFIVKM